MAESALLGATGTLLNIGFLAPVIFGGGVLTVFKHCFKSEDEVSKEVTRLRENLLESVCESYTRLIPIVSDSFRSLTNAQPTDKDILSILRGDTKGQPDICLLHFRHLSTVIDHLINLGVIKRTYKQYHTWMLTSIIVAILSGLCAGIFSDIRLSATFVGVAMFLLQVFLVMRMRQVGSALDAIGDLK